MRSQLLFVCAVVALLCCAVSAFGTLYVNSIVATTDTNTVLIEGVTIDGADLQLTQAFGATGPTTTVAGVQFSATGLSAVSATVLQATVLGALNLTSGPLTVTAPVGGATVFSATSSGQVTAAGSATIVGALSVNIGNFQATPAALTGQGNGSVTVGGVLAANGGIDIDNGQFAVYALDGSLVTAGALTAADGLTFSGASGAAIARFASASPVGGNTIVAGQSSTVSGGNLFVEPGYAINTLSGSNGNIYLGAAVAQPLTLGRSALTPTAAAGGATTFSGQSAGAGAGGALFVQAGSGAGSSSQSGGSVYLTPGVGLTSGAPGALVLGSPVDATAAAPVTVTRVPLTGGLSGGTTIVSGQSSQFGVGGALQLQAGNATAAASGAVRLLPGRSTDQQGAIGSIVLGTSNNDFVGFGRFPTSATTGSVASLTIAGQSSYGGNGGDLYFVAGSASTGLLGGPAQPAGVLYLSPGASAGSGAPGAIVVGLADHQLVLQAPQSTSAANGVATTISGQTSVYGVGGALQLQAGSGLTGGGNLGLYGGDSAGQPGPVGVSLASTAIGGSLFVLGGDATGADPLSPASFVGGSVLLQGGGTTQSLTNAGSVTLDAGVGGSIVVLPPTLAFNVNQVNTAVSAPLTILSNAGNSLTIAANPSAVLSYNGTHIVTARPSELFLVLDVRSDTAENVSRLQDALITLINALGPCGHGLITYANPAGTPITTCLVADSYQLQIPS